MAEFREHFAAVTGVEATWQHDREAVLRVLDALGQGVTVVDAQARFEYVNPAYSRMVGRPVEELIGARPHDMTHPGDLPVLQDAWLRRVRGDANTLHLRLIRPDGVITPVTATGVPRMVDSKFAGSFAVVTDLTGRQKMEDSLRLVAEGVSADTGEAFFHSLLQHLAEATGADAIGVGEVVPPKKTQVKMLACWLDGEIQENFEYELHGTPCERVLEDGICLQVGVVQEEFPEDDFIREAGMRSYCGVALMDSNGQPLGVLCLMSRSHFADPDVAIYVLRIFATRAAAEIERQRREREQWQSHKLESLGRLAGGIAHDFNNLMTAILGAVELASDQITADHPLQVELEDIKNAAGRASDLTERLLGLARRQISNPATVDLNELVKETKRLLARVLGEQIELCAELASDLRPVRVDPGQIQQVLFNLVVNAKDAMPDGGRLTITTANESPEEEENSLEAVALRVADTGSGMSADTLANIFDPFFTTKDQGSGTGLGLATSHGLVTQNGGLISVQSTPGKGTEFEVRLPASKDKPTPARTKEETVQTSVGGHQTLLLAEDDELVRAPLVKALRAASYNVLEADSGASALQVAAQHSGPIDMLITDVVMPQMNGAELADELRRKRSGIQVLYMSGYPKQPALRQRLSSCSEQFLQKPFRPADLLQKVNKVFTDSAIL